MHIRASKSVYLLGCNLKLNFIISQTNFMKIFKFLAVFLIVLGLVYIVVIGLNWNVFKTVFSNQEAMAEGSEWIEKTFSLAGLTEFIVAHPPLVSVVMDDSEGEASSTISFQEAVPRAMGSTGHLFLLLAYAEQVSVGALSPSQKIPLDDIERFAVPGYEPNRHKESIRFLSNNGKIVDGNVALDDLVAVMVLRNHQPSADALYVLLGKDVVADVVQGWAGNNAEVPKLWSAFHVATNLVENLDETESENLTFESTYQEIATQLVSPGTTVKSVFEYFKIDDLNYSFIEEKTAYLRLPKAMPFVMVEVLRSILDDDMDVVAQEIVLRHLSWPIEDDKVKRDFTAYYAIYDSRMSISSGLTIGTNVYTGRTHISAVYFDQLPIGFWMHMSSNLINQDFQMRLKYDPALFERTYIALMQN
jgi:hypothetical protein